jgi:hypothetical protein
VNHYRITRVITPATSLDLVTLDQAKALLGIDPADTSKDAQISQHIAATSAAINNYCDRIFVQQVYRDQVRNAYGGYGEPFVTRQYPIALDVAGVPLVAVTEAGVALDPAYLEVYPEAGSLYRLDGTAAPYAWNTATTPPASIRSPPTCRALVSNGFRSATTRSGAIPRSAARRFLTSSPKSTAAPAIPRTQRQCRDRSASG